MRAQIVLDQPDLFGFGKMHVGQFLEPRAGSHSLHITCESGEPGSPGPGGGKGGAMRTVDPKHGRPPHARTLPRRPEPADLGHNHSQETVGHVAIDAQINRDATEFLFASSGRADGADRGSGFTLKEAKAMPKNYCFIS